MSGKILCGDVLDPFCGSGTTLVVAKRLGRKYVGIDLNEDYVCIAKERLSREDLIVPLSHFCSGLNKNLLLDYE